MHYVLIWWFKERIQPLLKGYSGLVVYADDFVATFQHKNEAEWFYEQLKRRMGNFGLSLEEEKSRLIEFGRFAEQNCAKRGTRPTVPRAGTGGSGLRGKPVERNSARN